MSENANWTQLHYIASTYHLQYIGSFMVHGDASQQNSSRHRPSGSIDREFVHDNEERVSEFVAAHLDRLHSASASRQVLLVVSLAGLKMCSEDGRVCYHGD
jgi:hypothetical protein